MYAKSVCFDVNHELFKTNSAYVRNALVLASQGIYSKYEYLEHIFYDAILATDTSSDNILKTNSSYEKIGEYAVNDYVERPHEYVEDK